MFLERILVEYFCNQCLDIWPSKCCLIVLFKPTLILELEKWDFSLLFPFIEQKLLQNTMLIFCITEKVTYFQFQFDILESKRLWFKHILKLLPNAQITSIFYSNETVKCFVLQINTNKYRSISVVYNMGKIQTEKST